jgi:hypothetical protein
LEHLCKKNIRELSTKYLHKEAIEAEHRIADKATTEGLTHSNLYTSCITAGQPTTTPNIAPSFWSCKRKWSKILLKLHIIANLRSQSHHAVGSPPPVIFLILPFTFLPQAYHCNQTQPLAYYQSYHYTTTNHPQPSPSPQITYPSPVPQITYPCQTTPTLKSKPKPIHHHHLHNKPMFSPHTTQSSQLSEVPIRILTPRDSAVIIIGRLITSPVKVPLHKPNGPTCP